jgi:hypothetical protein
VDCCRRQVLHVMLERGELASLHQDIPARSLDASQTGLRAASPTNPVMGGNGGRGMQFAAPRYGFKPTVGA